MLPLCSRNRLGVRIASAPTHRSRPCGFWIVSLDTVHGVDPAAACARVCQLSGVFPLPPGERTLKAPGVSLDLGGRGVPWTPPSGAMPPLAARCRAGQQLPKPRTAPHELPRRRSVGPFYRRLLLSVIAGLPQQPDAMLAMVAGHRDGLVQNSGFLPLG